MRMPTTFLERAEEGKSAMLGWFPIWGESGLTDLKHYVEVRRGESVSKGHARCGMVSGTIERRFLPGLLRRKCRKCKVSEMADKKW